MVDGASELFMAGEDGDLAVDDGALEGLDTGMLDLLVVLGVVFFVVLDT